MISHLVRAGLLCASIGFFPRAVLAQVGSAFCFGNACPCGNDDDAAGCGNFGFDGDVNTGALLEALGGTTDVLLDDLDLKVSGVQAGQMGMIFMGDAAVSLPFGDGLRCVGGGVAGLYRFPAKAASTGGGYHQRTPVHASESFPGGGAITAGSTWYFQGWFRDPGGPCGSAFNLTNGLRVTFTPPGSGGPIRTELAGNPLSSYPWFDFVRSINQGAAVQLALDPALYPFTVGATADVYVVTAKTREQWAADPTLFDVRGGPQTIAFPGTDLPTNIFLVDGGTLNGTTGTRIGVGYDLILDFDQDGVLGNGDFIDGDTAPDGNGEAGFYVVRDTTLPGPYTVVEGFNNSGTWLLQDIYYPASIANLGQLPLVMVSHGNGHNYQWYDHIGYHLASYGYVVVSHSNNTQPGIGAASLTTLQNTDFVLGNLSTILGGVLDGHVNSHKIVWIGHSRGGEGIVRAYTRMLDGYATANFGVKDLVLLSSIAPTDFLGTLLSNPHDVGYHLWVGAGDADVTGGPEDNVAQSYHLVERAQNRRLVTTLFGAGHGMFHDGGGSLVFTGPCMINRPTGHPIMLGYLLPLVENFVRKDIPSQDFLWRQYERFHPPSVATSNLCVVVNLEYKDGVENGNFVIDDYQSQATLGLSSSGGSVDLSVSNPLEGVLNDGNTSFTWLANDPMNGMTRARATDTTRGLVFDWNEPSYYELEIVPEQRDLRRRAYLAFRATQCTRHPYTTAALGDLVYSVTLRDGSGTTSTISIGAYGGGTEEPYQRTGSGPGVGWGNDFETIRIRLRDFLAEGSGLDLSDVVAVRFEFGLPGESPQGRMGLDDIELTRN